MQTTANKVSCQTQRILSSSSLHFYYITVPGTERHLINYYGVNEWINPMHLLFPVIDNVNSSRNFLPKFTAGSLLLFVLDSTGKVASTKRLKYIKAQNNKGLFFFSYNSARWIYKSMELRFSSTQESSILKPCLLQNLLIIVQLAEQVRAPVDKFSGPSLETVHISSVHFP